jgi:hypothetical protein
MSWHRLLKRWIKPWRWTPMMFIWSFLLLIMFTFSIFLFTLFFPCYEFLKCHFVFSFMSIRLLVELFWLIVIITLALRVFLLSICLALISMLIEIFLISLIGLLCISRILLIFFLLVINLFSVRFRKSLVSLWY